MRGRAEHLAVQASSPRLREQDWTNVIKEEQVHATSTARKNTLLYAGWKQMWYCRLSAWHIAGWIWENLSCNLCQVKSRYIPVLQCRAVVNQRKSSIFWLMWKNFACCLYVNWKVLLWYWSSHIHRCKVFWTFSLLPSEEHVQTAAAPESQRSRWIKKELFSLWK